MSAHRINGKSTASTGSDNDISLIDYDQITLKGQDVILFVWQDETESIEYTNSFGMILQRTLSTNRPRWGVVVKSNCIDVSVGNYILPEDVTEKFGVVFESVEHWRTTPDKILLVTDDVEVTRTLEDA
jgi:hypothetical protein